MYDTVGAVSPLNLFCAASNAQIQQLPSPHICRIGPSVLPIFFHVLFVGVYMLHSTPPVRGFGHCILWGRLVLVVRTRVCAYSNR